MSDQFKAKGFLVWGICALFFLYEFLLRTVMGTYQHPVMQDLNLTSFQFSLLSTTIFLFVYGMMQIPVGVIVENLGLKKSLLIGALCCSVSAIGFAYAYNYPLAAVYRMFMGLGASFGFICLLISVHEWMPRRYSGIFIGLSQFIGTMGPVLAAGPLDSLSEAEGVSWRMVFLVLGGVGLIIGLLIALFVENNLERKGRYTILNRPEKVSTSLIRLFSRMEPWFIALLSASLYFNIEYLSENEGRTFLSLKGISLNSASYMITIAWVGYAVGCPLLGFVSDMVERRQSVIQFSAYLGVAAITAILYGSDKTFLQIAFFLLGVGASGQSVAFAVVTEQFKRQFVAVGFGLNNAMITTLSAINAPLIGLLLDNKTGGACLENYMQVFLILAAISLIALVLAIFFLRETYCKSQVGFTILKPKSQGQSYG